MDLAARERDVYESVWGMEEYGEFSPGERYLPVFLGMLAGEATAKTYTIPGGGVIERRPTVLDAGTGSGKGALALDGVGFDVRCCDITDAGMVARARAFPFDQVCMWDDLTRTYGPQRFDYVYCCDVMEHIPTSMTMLVVSRLLAVARYGVFFSISTVPDAFGARIGQPLHLTVEPFTWWRDNLAAIGDVKHARDMVNVGCYLVVPR